MGINLGAFFGPLVCAWLAVRYGWSAGFAAAGGGMVLGLSFYLWARRRWLADIGLSPTAHTSVSSHRVQPALTRVEQQRIAAIVLITAFVVIFWLAFEQVGSSLNV